MLDSDGLPYKFKYKFYGRCYGCMTSYHVNTDIDLDNTDEAINCLNDECGHGSISWIRLTQLPGEYEYRIDIFKPVQTPTEEKKYI